MEIPLGFIHPAQQDRPGGRLKFHLDCYVKPLPAILIGVGVAIVLNVVLPTYSWLTFLIKVVGIVVGFFVGMWLIGFNEYEKSLLKDIIKKIVRR